MRERDKVTVENLVCNIHSLGSIVPRLSPLAKINPYFREWGKPGNEAIHWVCMYVYMYVCMHVCMLAYMYTSPYMSSIANTGSL